MQPDRRPLCPFDDRTQAMLALVRYMSAADLSLQDPSSAWVALDALVARYVEGFVSGVPDDDFARLGCCL